MSYSWIARRARRIEKFYGLYAGRRMAIRLAIDDWKGFHPEFSVDASD